jgi:hypothetical protein
MILPLAVIAWGVSVMRMARSVSAPFITSHQIRRQVNVCEMPTAVEVKVGPFQRRVSVRSACSVATQLTVTPVRE